MDTDDTMMLPEQKAKEDALSALPRDKQARILRAVCQFSPKEKISPPTFPDRGKPL